ncbi:MFS transporter [Halovulum dunhuangense]|uniref:MFS transporter n=1 Tax=Halovulum dunhuangense TaxID=1505036 RepID=A0A849L1L4_9RHOB|nr:MFS transporter [Halovulum dunhuangense]NNU80131.1 MFS transporter [Halovulum dunhuangense]
MIAILANRTYRHLFAAQVIALVGTGLATVALGLLAWQLAGADAGMVLGTALAIKMVAYVTLAPIATALAERVPRRAMLIALDLIRAAVALALPFVTEVWQVYALIFLLQAASAGFTPTFQAVIPDVLPDEAAYTRALSLSRLAYDLESLLSPLLAAALLTVVGFPVLFGGTVLGFLASALLVASTRLPAPEPAPRRPFGARLTRGLRIYLATPRLRGLLALNLAVAAAGAMVIVNTVVLVKARLGLGEPQVALALAAFGAGSMISALALPRLLERTGDRPAMLAGAILLTLGMLAGPMADALPPLLMLWAALGLGYGLVLTPAGRLLRRSAQAADRPALFAAQFALSHACWLVTYPLAGRLGAGMGLDAAFLVMALLSGLGLVLALRLWPASAGGSVPHAHPDLPPDHPHLMAHGGALHAHPWVIDDLHPSWQSRPARA